MRSYILLIFASTLVLTSCRARIGEPCQEADGCALGLYCDMEREVCDDRGKLLKKGAAETYVYPIPPKNPQAAPVPVPVPSKSGTDTEKDTR